MGNSLRIAVVIPAHNEAENIARLITGIRKNSGNKNTDITVFIVDDASTDQTANIARAEARKKSKIKVELLSRRKSSGIGGAYIYAFKKIIPRNFDYILQMDADLQHDPKYIKGFARMALAGKDVVVSSRYIKGGATPDWNIRRRLLSKWGNRFIRLFLGSRFTDWTGGYNLYKVSVLEKVDPAKLPHDFCFQLGLKNAISEITENTGEIPIVFCERTRGVSKMSRSATVKTFRSVLALWFRKLSGGKRRSL
jgi:dolichol-phosphate mannosyltransferase